MTWDLTMLRVALSWIASDHSRRGTNVFRGIFAGRMVRRVALHHHICVQHLACNNMERFLAARGRAMQVMDSKVLNTATRKQCTSQYELSAEGGGLFR